MSTAQLERRAARIALVTSVVLLLTKLAAWRLTGSTAVFGDAMESVVNVAASALVIWSVWMANRPADESHPYGHGKAEFLSSAIEGGMISVAMLVVMVRSALELFDRSASIEKIDFGLLLLAFTIIANGGVGLWLIQVGRTTKSSALHADGIHLISDAWTSGAAVVSLLLVRWTDLAYIDPIIALIMADPWLTLDISKRPLSPVESGSPKSDSRILSRCRISCLGHQAVRLATPLAWSARELLADLRRGLDSHCPAP